MRSFRSVSIELYISTSRVFFEEQVTTALAGASVKKIPAVSTGEQELIRILDWLTVPNLFEPRRTLVIIGIESLSKAALAAVVAALPDVTNESLILWAPSLDKRHQLRSAVEKHQGKVIELLMPEGAALRSWCSAYCKLISLSITRAQIESVISKIDGSLDQLASSFQLLELASNGEPVTTDLIDSLLPDALSENDFAILEAIEKGDRREIEHHFQALVDGDKSPFMTTGLIGRTYTLTERMHSLLKASVDQGAARALLGIAPWLGDRYAKTAKKASTRRLQNSVKLLSQTDETLKGRGLPENLALYRLLAELHAMTRRGAS